jgi:isoprenylcysteine carboxyl methyltransferase (ICMT) family protein YpbQ
MRQRGESWELKVYLGREAVTGVKHWAYRTLRVPPTNHLAKLHGGKR